MENSNKNKKTIIILSVALSIISIAIITVIISWSIYKNTIIIKLTDKYNITEPVVSLYTYYEVEIECNENKIINVNDFTIKENKGNIQISKIDFNNKTYEKNESFIIQKNNINKLTIYYTPTSEENVDAICYKFMEVKLYESIKIQQKN